MTDRTKERWHILLMAVVGTWAGGLLLIALIAIVTWTRLALAGGGIATP